MSDKIHPLTGQPMSEINYVQPVPFEPKPSSGLAIASLVLGILWIFWIGSILAVIFGHTALKSKNTENRGLAVAGLVLGYIGIGTLSLWILLAIAAAGSA